MLGFAEPVRIAGESRIRLILSDRDNLSLGADDDPPRVPFAELIGASS